MRSFCCLIVLLLSSPAFGAQPLQLWLYQQTNLLPEANIQSTEQLWERAAKAGYTHILLADSKFARLGDLGDNTQTYLDHLKRLRETAKRLNLQIVPAGFDIGYSNNLLWHDPNLAEGLPVRGALFVVNAGEARLVADPPVSLLAMPTWYDRASLKIDNGVATETGHWQNARLVWRLRLAPYRCYHVSVDIRTTDYTGTPEIKPLANGKPLAFTKLGVKPTQNWTTHHFVFNSLDNTDVSLYMGVWGQATGHLQWRNWKIQEVGLLNVLRREGAPCVVEGYSEGKDYEPIVDPKMGRVPWPGSYEVYHQPPTIKTKLPDGTRLRVSWYMPTIINDEQVCCCPSESKVYDLLADQARRLQEAWGARAMMMSHDEIRVMNQDKSCLDRKLSPGQILADNVRRCVKILKDADVYVWNDMFDPFHNATKEFYLVNGDLTASWEGLETRVTVINWNYGQRDKSLAFFAGRGHKQIIAGYYDGDVQQIRKWLDSAAKVQGVKGVMYTTWEQKYADLEEFAKLVRSGQ